MTLNLFDSPSGVESWQEQLGQGAVLLRGFAACLFVWWAVVAPGNHPHSIVKVFWVEFLCLQLQVP
jgi:hypothetical protein